MQNIIEKSKALFYKMIEDFGEDPWKLGPHLPEVEIWTKFLLEKHPEADKEVVMLAVWLHDIGHYPLPHDEGHEIVGERRAKEFLEDNNFDPEKIPKVLHCVRSHRNRDVKPESIEAKILVCADSASHLSEPTMYPSIIADDSKGDREPKAPGKIERDWRDICMFPEIKEELKDKYLEIKKMIESSISNNI